MEIKRVPISPTLVVKQALEVIVPQAKLKDIRIEERLEPNFYQTLADKDMLYQAVLNLLSNAVKYTPAGGTVTVSSNVDEVRKTRDTACSGHRRRYPSKGPALCVR